MIDTVSVNPIIELRIVYTQKETGTKAKVWDGRTLFKLLSTLDLDLDSRSNFNVFEQIETNVLFELELLAGGRNISANYIGIAKP